jgi:hypothetical protein
MKAAADKAKAATAQAANGKAAAGKAVVVPGAGRKAATITAAAVKAAAAAKVEAVEAKRLADKATAIATAASVALKGAADKAKAATAKAAAGKAAAGKAAAVKGAARKAATLTAAADKAAAVKAAAVSKCLAEKATVVAAAASAALKATADKAAAEKIAAVKAAAAAQVVAVTAAAVKAAAAEEIKVAAAAAAAANLAVVKASAVTNAKHRRAIEAERLAVVAAQWVGISRLEVERRAAINAAEIATINANSLARNATVAAAAAVAAMFEVVKVAAATRVAAIREPALKFLAALRAVAAAEAAVVNTAAHAERANSAAVRAAAAANVAVAEAPAKQFWGLINRAAQAKVAALNATAEAKKAKVEERNADADAEKAKAAAVTVAFASNVPALKVPARKFLAAVNAAAAAKVEATKAAEKQAAAGRVRDAAVKAAGGWTTSKVVTLKSVEDTEAAEIWARRKFTVPRTCGHTCTSTTAAPCAVCEFAVERCDHVDCRKVFRSCLCGDAIQWVRECAGESDAAIHAAQFEVAAQLFRQCRDNFGAVPLNKFEAVEVVWGLPAMNSLREQTEVRLEATAAIAETLGWQRFAKALRAAPAISYAAQDDKGQWEALWRRARLNPTSLFVVIQDEAHHGRGGDSMTTTALQHAVEHVNVIVLAVTATPYSFLDTTDKRTLVRWFAPPQYTGRAQLEALGKWTVVERDPDDGGGAVVAAYTAELARPAFRQRLLDDGIVAVRARNVREAGSIAGGIAAALQRHGDLSDRSVMNATGSKRRLTLSAIPPKTAFIIVVGRGKMGDTFPQQREDRWTQALSGPHVFLYDETLKFHTAAACANAENLHQELGRAFGYFRRGCEMELRVSPSVDELYTAPSTLDEYNACILAGQRMSSKNERGGSPTPKSRTYHERMRLDAEAAKTGPRSRKSAAEQPMTTYVSERRVVLWGNPQCGKTGAVLWFLKLVVDHVWRPQGDSSVDFRASEADRSASAALRVKPHAIRRQRVHGPKVRRPKVTGIVTRRTTQRQMTDAINSLSFAAVIAAAAKMSSGTR